MGFDYRNDPYGRECLELARQSQADVAFGAELIKDGRVIGRGYTRRATSLDRKFLAGVAYYICAERAAIVDALQRGKAVHGGEIYVLGVVQHGRKKGRLTARRSRVFHCRACPPSFQRFGISVHIPLFSGWSRMSPEEVVESVRKHHRKGHWRRFAGYRKEKTHG